jgi:hypothetical protein
LENTKETNKFFKIIILVAWNYGCTTHHSPGMNRKVWGTRLILRSCPEHCGFCVSSHLSWITETARVGSTGRYTSSQTHNSALLSSLSSLSNSICRHRSNVLLLRNVFLLLRLGILIVRFTLTEGFPCFFLSCKANARV